MAKKQPRPIAINNVTSPAELSRHLPGIGATWAQVIYNKLQDVREAGRRMTGEDFGDVVPYHIWLTIGALISFDSDVVVNGRMVITGVNAEKFLPKEEREALREVRLLRRLRKEKEAKERSRRFNDKVRYSIRGEPLSQNLGALFRAAGL